MDLSNKLLTDFSASIKESADTDPSVMASKLTDALIAKGWLILYGREVPEVDLQVEIHGRLSHLESMIRNLEDGLQRLINAN